MELFKRCFTDINIVGVQEHDDPEKIKSYALRTYDNGIVDGMPQRNVVLEHEDLDISDFNVIFNISYVIDDIITSMKFKAETSTADIDDGVNIDPSKLGMTVLDESNKILLKSCRGRGNFVIGRRETISHLKTSPIYKSLPTSKHRMHLEPVGEINGTTVYDYDGDSLDDKLLIGYTGNAEGQWDTGITLNLIEHENELKYRITELKGCENFYTII